VSRGAFQKALKQLFPGIGFRLATGRGPNGEHYAFGGLPSEEAPDGTD
jgi:hypothetical protein